VRDKQNRETLRKAEQQQAAEKAVAGNSDPAENLEMEGLDFAEGVKRYGSQDVYLRILQSYLTHTPKLLDKLRSLTRETLPDYAITVHGLKGASYGICAGPIGKDAEELEHAAKAGDYEAVNSKNAAFLAKVEESLENLGKLLKAAAESDNQEKKRTAAAPDRALLEKLLDASKRFKPAIMDEVMAELEGWEYEAGGDLIPWLREQIDNLEYDAVREKLESLSAGE
jgi:hypothetical protein